jgi:hypothetical protein
MRVRRIIRLFVSCTSLVRTGHDDLLNPESAMAAPPVAGDPKASAKQTPAGNSLPQH